MAFASALSLHPVPAFATGEIVGQVLEALGPGPDLAVLVARPGVAGALEDMAGAVTALLRPSVLLSGITTAVGDATTFVERGPAVGLWAATCGTCRPFVADGADRARFVLAAAGERVEVPLAGPVLAGPAAATTGVHVDAALTVRDLRGLRPVGPPVRITASAGRSVVELDGRPAIERITAVARQHLPAADLRRLSAQLQLLGPSGCAVRLLGTDPRSGAVVVADGWEPEAGTTVSVVVADRDYLPVELHAAVGHGRAADAALVFAAAGDGRRLTGAGPGVVHDLDTDAPAPILPPATLICERADRSGDGAGGPAGPGPATTLVLFGAAG